MVSERKCVKNFVVFFLTFLLYVSFANADWTAGDDITIAGFSWNKIPPEISMSFPFVDNNGIVRECSCKFAPVIKNYDPTHVYTTAGTGIYHLHFQYNFGDDVSMATVAQAEAFWNARFQSPSMCGQSETATNTQNCYAWAFYWSFDGEYNYWINGMVSTILNEDAQQITTKSNVAVEDVLVYGSEQHATYVYGVSSGQPTTKVWKYASSGIYYIDTGGFNTPMCAGNIYKDTPLNQQGWEWDVSGAGGDIGQNMKIWRRAN